MLPVTPPVVSILMPVYNVGKYLTRAVQSIQDQGFADWELLIANDGSTDDTLAVARQLAEADPRITVIHFEQNRGNQAEMRNAGLLRSRGRYIANMDGDDAYEPGALQTMVNYLDNHSDCMMVYGCYGNIDSDDKPFPSQIQGVVWRDNRFVCDPSTITNRSDFHVLDEHTWFNVLTGRVDNHVQAMLFRKEAFDKMGMWTEEYGFYTDVDLVFRAYHHFFNQIHALPEVVFRYRISSVGNLSNNPTIYLKRVREVTRLYQDFFQRYEPLPRPLRSKVIRINLGLIALTAARNKQYGQFFQIMKHYWAIADVSKRDAVAGSVKTLVRAARMAG